MHFTFSSTDHTNTDVSNEQGRICCTISTPPASKKVTTITKYWWEDVKTITETMGTIEWHEWTETKFRFHGKVFSADSILSEGHPLSSGRYFTGPDQQIYKWKLDSHCWMKSAKSDIELVRFHMKNVGIMKPLHPPYLEVSDSVIPMLDHIILTFVYVESLRIRRLLHGGAVGPDLGIGTAAAGSVAPLDG